MNKHKILSEFRNKIPFLKQIPDSIFFNLNSSDWFLPDKEIDKIRQELENKLKQNVMTYKLEKINKKIPRNKQLCSHLKPAKLDKEKIKILKNYEKKVKTKKVSFSVYQEPQVLIKKIYASLKPLVNTWVVFRHMKNL